jgi:exodeoxyribonuclease VII large subunit
MIGSDPTFSVSQFVAVFNQSLELMLPRVSIVGELANFRISKGRWVYFDLKDETASVKFFGSVASIPAPMEDGMNLEVFGYPRLHQKYGFSVNVERLRVVGEGSIAKAKKLLARKLELEGLFSDERKRPLPYPPASIGLITSVESAAYSDFIKILDHRWGNMRIQLIDCLVQGEDAPAQIIGGIEYFNQSAKPPEAVVIIRGGGSADDLESFSREQVVRAVASSRVPTIVAIGHERDISLAELAADRRASTPSNAAEMLVPDRSAEKDMLRVGMKRLDKAAAALVRNESDDISALQEAMKAAAARRWKQEQQAHRQKISFLRALDPSAPLKKGFALVRNEKGQVVRSIKPIKIDDKLSLDLSDGSADVKVLTKKGKNG